MEDLSSILTRKKFATAKQAIYWFQQKRPDIPKANVRKAWEEWHRPKYIKRYNKTLMGNTFSTVSDAYQIDIYFEAKRPYLLCVNVNTRYAWIERLKSKGTNDVLEAFDHFAKALRPSSVRCDAEAAFSSYRFVDYCKANRIALSVVLGSLHSDLGILNRLCRTLRAMSEPAETAVKHYNKRYNDAIKMAPRDMQFDPNEEMKYVFKQMDIRDRKKRLLLDESIKKGDKVRYVLDEKPQRMSKGQHRRGLSKYYYIVEYKRSPFVFDIIAQDGSVKTLPRYRLYKTKGHDVEFAPSIEDGSSFLIYDEITDYHPVFKRNGELNLNKTRYSVRVISRDAEGKKVKRQELYSVRQLRIGNPNELVDLEKAFLEKHRDRYRLDEKTNLIVPK